jgi:hypothetical protein
MARAKTDAISLRSLARRFIALDAGPRVAAAAVANAGFYSMPALDAPYPFGLGRLGLGQAGLARFLAAPLAVLVGDADVGVANLNRSPAARRQGPHRLARGLRFVAAGRRAAARSAAPAGWTVGVVAGAGHDGARMVAAAAAALFGPAPAPAPPPSAIGHAPARSRL